MQQTPQPGFPFHLYQPAKADKKLRVEKFGEFFHVLIEREDTVMGPMPPQPLALVIRSNDSLINTVLLTQLMAALYIETSALKYFGSLGTV